MDTLTTSINEGLAGTAPSTALGAGMLLGTGLGIAVGTITIISLIVFVLLVIAWWKIFKKAGEKGWKSIIPIYNIYILFKIFWEKKMFWIIFAVALCSGIVIGILNSFVTNAGALIAGNVLSIGLSIFTIVMDVILSNRMSKSFGHGVGYTIGLIFLPNIFTLILAFSGDKYKKIKEA